MGKGKSLVHFINVGLNLFAPKSLRIVFFEYPISNTELSMIKGGSRCAPLSYLIVFHFVSSTFYQLNNPAQQKESKPRRQPTWTLDIPCWILDIHLFHFTLKHHRN